MCLSLDGCEVSWEGSDFEDRGSKGNSQQTARCCDAVVHGEMIGVQYGCMCTHIYVFAHIPTRTYTHTQMPTKTQRVNNERHIAMDQEGSSRTR